ncbi:unnamed protein product [Clonostachys solani]|uniref:Uncharacterized protein n=1 Tax=Clonostachys solani TaxID=160281 RepID=A0A9P0EP05_9HYPO|nr:unnamed protein product [Clonostachys solani]
MLFNFFVAALLDVTEQVQVAKFMGGKQGADGGLGQAPGLHSVAQEGWLGMLRWCGNIVRLHRDANLMPIWEGITDMMADDSMLRVLHGKLRNRL